jgi:CheY-like chemotaxis protein
LPVSSKRVLCVDDDANTLEARKLLLQTQGYSVLSADSGTQALRLLDEGAGVDLVLLDYVMPGMNGESLAQELRKRYPELPLVLVSAVEQLPESLLKIIDARILKGHEPEVLLSTIAWILDRPVRHQSAPAKTILCVEDEELQLKSRTLLFESAGYRVLPAQTAAAALEAFNSFHIDAVVMDYWLSGKDGNGTVLAEKMKRIRPRTPIVMLSSFASLPGEGAIVDAWVRKAEIEPEKLLEVVQRLIELRGPQQQGAE